MRRKTIKRSTAPSYFFIWQIMGKKYLGFEPLAFKLVAIARTISRNACQLMEQQISYYYCHGSPYQPPTPEILLLKAIPKFWILPAPFPLCRHFSLLEELETRQSHTCASPMISNLVTTNLQFEGGVQVLWNQSNQVPVWARHSQRVEVPVSVRTCD